MVESSEVRSKAVEWHVERFERAPEGSSVKLIGFHVKDAEGVVIAEQFPQPWRVAVNEEYARLIAAAPDLLAALASLVDEALTYNGNRIEIGCADHSAAMNRVRVAREALIKARGIA